VVEMFISYLLFFFFKQKTAYEIMPSLVGSEMCIRDRYDTQWQNLMAATTISIIPIIVIFFLAQKTFVEGITLTGIKG